MKRTHPLWRTAMRALENPFGIDARSLAAFRVCLGIVVLIDLILRADFITAFYSDRGVLPRSNAIGSLHTFRWSVNFLNGTPEFAQLVFAAAIISAVLVILGWHTRVAIVVLWVAVVSLQTRNPYLQSGADTFIRVSLFWAMFLPLGRVWSLDAQTHARDVLAATRSHTVYSIATAGLTLQIACVYLFTALLKSGDKWRADGTALYYALGARELTTDLGNWLFLSAPPTLLKSLTYGTLLLEFAVPLMLVIPSRGRILKLVAALAILSLHFGIMATMLVGLFPAIGIASAVAILPSSFWDAASRVISRMPRWKRLLDRWPMAGAQIPGTSQGERPVPATEEFAAPPRPATANLHFIPPLIPAGTSIAGALANLFCLSAIGAMLLWNLTSVMDFSVPTRVNQATVATGLYQRWSMFAPGPQTATMWFVVEGELDSGEKVDLLQLLFTEDVDGSATVVWDQSNDPIVRDKYWRKYLTAIRSKDTELQKFAAYACRTWNRTNEGDRHLEALSVSSGSSATLPDGKRADPVFRELGSWHCL